MSLRFCTPFSRDAGKSIGPAWWQLNYPPIVIQPPYGFSGSAMSHTMRSLAAMGRFHSLPLRVAETGLRNWILGLTSRGCRANLLCFRCRRTKQAQREQLRCAAEELRHPRAPAAFVESEVGKWLRACNTPRRRKLARPQ